MQIIEQNLTKKGLKYLADIDAYIAAYKRNKHGAAPKTVTVGKEAFAALTRKHEGTPQRGVVTIIEGWV